VSEAVAAVRMPSALRALESRAPSPYSRTRRRVLEKSGLPRSAWGQRHDTPEGREWSRYLGALVDRLGLPRPCPRWAVAHLSEAGHSHLILLRLRDALATEAHPIEARRLRSEARRTASQRNRCEAVLAKLATEHRPVHDVAADALSRLSGGA
jgi:hypothetical protein